ncbi:OmpA family protein [Flavihumibacter solisilvae]|uniref:OmpA family protein n=1 Tax=Flavihumibacter solisilvae TaxID=1349421 RepID=UPI000690AE5D|nr:OmpA family protein [Flavihumibacter solisilvae]
MKKIVLSVLTVCCYFTNSFGQDENYIKRPAIGIHFFGNDFVTPQRIRSTSLSTVLKDNDWAKFSDLNFGFAGNYMKGLSNHFDFSTTLGVSFLEYPMDDKPQNGKDGALFEWDAMVHGKMVSDKYWVSPYISAGIGASQWRGYFGAFIPVGVGIQVNFFDEAFLLINTQYRMKVTSTTNYHFYQGIGFAGNIGRPKEEKVIPPPPPPVVVVEQEKDQDSDGIADKDDKCPTQPGIARYEGCPIPDTDGDGINDEEDKCKDVAGLARYQGCPVPDTDKDGVNDEEDKCPDVPGLADNFGCPRLETSKFNASNVQFVTGSATLTAGAKKELDKAAKILNEEYPQLKVDIVGHTDNTGGAELNQKLSEKRANAVKAYLGKKGVAADRLTATGQGQGNPITDNNSSAGRAKNRRVEFKISQ